MYIQNLQQQKRWCWDGRRGRGVCYKRDCSFSPQGWMLAKFGDCVCFPLCVVLYCTSTCPLCLPCRVFAGLSALSEQSQLLLSEDILQQVTGASLSLLQWCLYYTHSTERKRKQQLKDGGWTCKGGRKLSNRAPCAEERSWVMHVFPLGNALEEWWGERKPKELLIH